MKPQKPDGIFFSYDRMAASASHSADLRNHATVLGRCEDVDPVGLVIEDQKQAPLKLINDLKAAVEVNSSKGRSVLYPGKSMKFDGMPIEVSLRDDPSIRSICEEYDGTQLCMSSGAFRNFGTEVQHFIEQEDVSIQREERLQEQRNRELLKKAKWAAWGPFFRLNSCLWGVVLVFLVICLVVRLESYAVAVALGLGAGCLCCCTTQISVASLAFFDKKQTGARKVANDLHGQQVNVKPSRLEWFLVLFPFCLSVLTFLVMTVMYSNQEFPWVAASLWIPVLLLPAFFIAVLKSKKIENAYDAVFARIFGDKDELEKEGKGKVENLSTAGAEHLRREQIFRRKGEFEESQEFKSAVTAGLEELSKQKCGDGSSQYSREEHRLFLSWLDDKDREFLISSEGL